MIFIKVFQRLSQFSGKVPLEHWVSRIAVNTCLNQIESEKVRPELRHADLTLEEQAVIENLATSSEELAPDRRFASRQLVEHLLTALKPVERLAIIPMARSRASRLHAWTTRRNPCSFVQR